MNDLIERLAGQDDLGPVDLTNEPLDKLLVLPEDVKQWLLYLDSPEVVCENKDRLINLIERLALNQETYTALTKQCMEQQLQIEELCSDIDRYQLADAQKVAQIAEYEKLCIDASDRLKNCGQAVDSKIIMQGLERIRGMK